MASKPVCKRCGCQMHPKHVCPRILTEPRSRPAPDDPEETDEPDDVGRRIDEGFSYGRD